ncbi:MAG: lysylphosphatidylglycerol synthase transmembrane domain-containing protein [Bacteroidota bacterium]
MKEQIKEFNQEQREVLDSIKISRIILPVLIGVGVVIFLVFRQFDPKEFERIEWTRRTFMGIGIAAALLIIRHLAYSMRLYILSNKDFTFRKCIELIFIWEFSSAVSPTSLGGSAVAFFVLAQEKLSTAKTATIVLYTIVLDTAFFILSIPILVGIFGLTIIRPDMDNSFDLDGWGYTFIFAYVLMAVYGTIFYFGLFHFPRGIKKFLVGGTKIRFLKRYRRSAIELGNDMIVASQQLKKQDWKFHLGGFLATATAWSCRFLILGVLVTGFVKLLPTDFMTQFALYARLETMFVIIAFSPTPGGAGFVEILFGGFLTDYVKDDTSAIVISTIWRLLTYYSYLIAGAIIIPNWLHGILRSRRRKKEVVEEQVVSEN